MARDHRPAARNAPSAPVAFAAAAALAPTEPPPPPEETGRVEGEPPTVEDLAADRAALISKVAALTAENEVLRDELASARRQHALAHEEALRLAGEIASHSCAREPEPAPEAPIAPRRPRAAGSLRCHLHGAPITVADGQEIPAGVDLSTLPPHAFVEG